MSDPAVPDGIHRIDTDFYGRTNSLYLLAGSEHTLLVDTGVASTPQDGLVPHLREHGIARVDLVVTTHADLDHCGGNAAVGELFPDSLSLCHLLDRPWVDDVDRLVEERYDEYAVLGIAETQDTKVFLRSVAGARPTAVAVSGGEQVRLGDGWYVELLHVPGHSPGHLAVWDPRSATAIVGDAVLADGLYLTDGTPAFPPTYRYVEDYLTTIETFAALRPARLLTSHYPTMTGPEVGSFLDRSRTFVDALDAALRQVLGDGPADLPALVRATAPMVGPWTGDAVSSLKFPLLGHLERLEATGAVRRDRSGGSVVFARND